MKSSTLSRALASFSVLSLSIAAALPAQAELATDKLLAAITEPVAARDGSVTFYDVTGQPLVLAYGAAAYNPYFVGLSVDPSTLVLCQGSALVSCAPIASNPGDPTAFWCGNDGIDSWCECDAGLDCLDMLVNGPCPDLEDWACDNDGCVCEA